MSEVVTNIKQTFRDSTSSAINHQLPIFAFWSLRVPWDPTLLRSFGKLRDCALQLIKGRGAVRTNDIDIVVGIQPPKSGIMGIPISAGHEIAMSAKGNGL